MAFGNDRQDSGSLYFTVKTGMDDKGRKQSVFALNCKEGTPGAKQSFKADGTPVLDRDGNTRWRMEYGYIEGAITGLEPHEAEINGKPMRFLNLHIEDAGAKYIVSLARGDRYWVDFLLRLRNLDLRLPVRMSPYSIEDEGRWNQGIAMKQGGHKIARAFTKENNYGELPAGEQKEFNGEMKWDFGPRDRWLEANVLADARVRLASDVVTAAKSAPPQLDAPVAEEDDLPF